MTSLFSKALVYLGLVDEDQADESPIEQSGGGYQTSGGGAEPAPQGRRVEPPPTARTAIRPQTQTSRTEAHTIPAQASSMVRPVEVQSDILVVEEFADARMLADRVRERVPVVLDLRRTDHDLTRRVVDFSSGLIYALDGKMRKVGEGLILVTPADMEPSNDEKRRLQSLGAYELPLDD